MKIDWAALGAVAVVSVAMSVAFVIFLALGIRLVSAGKLRSNQGGSGAVVLSLGYAMVGLAGFLVLYGLYWIVPQFH